MLVRLGTGAGTDEARKWIAKAESNLQGHLKPDVNLVIHLPIILFGLLATYSFIRKKR
jgi:hypothetical protein